MVVVLTVHLNMVLLVLVVAALLILVVVIVAPINALVAVNQAVKLIPVLADVALLPNSFALYYT